MTVDGTGKPPTPRRPISTTYKSYRESLDETAFASTEELPPKCSSQRHSSLRKFKQSEDLSANMDDIVCLGSEDIPTVRPSGRRNTFSIQKNSGFTSGFQRTFSMRSRRDSQIPVNESICLETFKAPHNEFATVRGGPYCRRRSSSRERCDTVLGRSSSEGDVRVVSTPLPTSGGPRLNRYLRALGGSWKNLLLLGGMSRGGASGKPAQAKRVPPPAIPGDTFNTPQHRHSGSSFGSQGYASSEDQGYPQPPDTPSHSRDDHSDYGSTVSGVSGTSMGKSPGGVCAGTFTFPTPAQPLTHKAAVYYHHQLALSDDQGIDMTQSPGRDSPGSSSGSAGSCSRHSSASLDSGRASGRMPPPHHNHHSACLCADHADRVRAMMAQGLPDHEIIHVWLTDLHLEEYAPLFAAAGYDLATMTRMTPEDLTAIGIKKPNHRKRLKAEMANLNVPDNLPDYVPGSLEEWLRLLRLEEYGPALMSQGYRTVQDVTQLTWEDLEDIGIVRLGHQKKILLGIKRVKDVRSGKRTLSNQGSLDLSALPHHTLGQESNPSYVHATQHAYQHPWELRQTRNMQYYQPQNQHKLMPLNFEALNIGVDLVPIQIRTPRGKSLESLEDICERSVAHSTFAADGTYCCWDGDVTPTNESGGGTLPRPRQLVRPRPVAKITGVPVDDYACYIYASPRSVRKVPSPPRRGGYLTTAEVHMEKPPLPLPAFPSSDSLSVSLDTGLLPPPAPAPPSPVNQRNNSDASFKSSSSTESDSLPFANENAGTIKQNRNQMGGRPHTIDYGRTGVTLSNLPPRHPCPQSGTLSHQHPDHKDVEKLSTEPADVLNDIGNMLANLTDELDAMLEEEKRQGLTET